MTILVIDDDRSIYETIEAILADDGYHCLTAKDTHEADLVLETIPVHGITLDLNIPGCKPIEWMHEIAAMAPDLVRRTLVVTASTISQMDRKRIDEAGAGLLLKPFAMSDLRNAVRTRIGDPDTGIEPVKPPRGSFRPISDEPE
ncbi:MAG: response regulator [Acidobacteria bacterium]|uniref:Response regulator n=1 Tax=Candidatus Polarisedimenticola svalbardensis TaxID=2886004 RepID=A0A8J7CD00_9BACT|nr:response regulator [Candidatus Polarisedimenticola svalbardensis]